MAHDLLIKGGHVVDPSQGINGIRDVALAGGKVAAVEESIPDGEAIETVDAAGLIVTPGLLDLHIHAYWGASHYGIEPDPYNIAKGVTTTLDVGSAGARTFPAFRKYIIERSHTRLYALLNISAMGMISNKIGGLEDLRWADVEDAVAMGQSNRDLVLGIKARLSRLQAGEQDMEALKRALEAAEILGTFVMIHIGDTKTPLEELAALLRPGDVITHCFTGRPHGVMDDAGRVFAGLREAQDRGVVFDIGHGQGSFSFDVTEKALSQGFYPGNISSDLHIYNIEGPVFDQLTTLSKFIYLGMSLEEVIRLSTESAARVMGKADRLGTLRVGAEGDVTLIRQEEGDCTLTDAANRTVQSRQRLTHVLTGKGGKVYRP